MTAEARAPAALMDGAPPSRISVRYRRHFTHSTKSAASLSAIPLPIHGAGRVRVCRRPAPNFAAGRLCPAAGVSKRRNNGAECRPRPPSFNLTSAV
ncbi:hypothetical protein EVAR_72673_1 [Eumeta japonica]|uniref:Uncharacterized protein n=1 Tax=Eumeta variegata TaxID=151549 RepID=A0A4C1SAR0_EUMVA|nr:hypothetical protein EVAR_72673_1 [Eumeta japonica]